MDLVKEAQWHLDLNGGFVPILEIQSGRLIPESKIIMAFAEESTQEGLTLVPKDPLLAVDMRVAMAKFDEIFDSTFWDVY